MTGSVRQPVTSDSGKNKGYRTANNIAPGVIDAIYG